MSAWNAYAVAALGIAAPLLLTEVARAVPVPAYVTAGQRAALAKLNASICGVSAQHADDAQATHRFLEVLRGLAPLRGAPTGTGLLSWVSGLNPFAPPTFVQLTPEDAYALCDAFIGAATAGASADTEPYALVGTFGPLDAPWWAASVIVDATTNAAERIAAGETPDNLSNLGSALVAVVAARQAVSSLGTDETAAFDAVPTQRAVWLLAVELDNAGYLVTGKPELKSLTGGLDAAAAAVGAWATSTLGDTAGVVAGGAAALALSTPVLLAIAGYCVLRAVRAG